MEPNEIEQRAKELLKDNPGLGRRRASKLLGVTQHTAQRILDAVRAGNPVVLPETKASTIPKGASLTKEQFRAKHDIVTRCREAITKGIANIGRDEFVPDFQFRAALGMSGSPCFRSVAAQFAHNQVRADGTLYWAHAETVTWALHNVQGARSVES